MDIKEGISSEQIIARLWQVAFGLLAFAIVPLGVGLRFRNGKHILIGVYTLGISFVIMLVATIIWGVGWIKKNVSIKPE